MQKLGAMKNAFAVSTNTYHNYTLDEALNGIAKAGFKNVELTAVKGWTEHVSAAMSAAEIADLRKKCKALGLNPIALSGHCNLMDDARLADFTANIELAGKLGCKYIVTSTGEAHFGHDQGSPEDVLIANIKKVLHSCESLGITMVLETHGEFGTGESLAKITRKVNSPYLGVNYDTANVVFYGKKLPDEEIARCIGEVKYVHLKDKAGEMGEWNFPALGKGELKLDRVLKALVDAGNASPISLEVEFTQAGAKNLAEVDKAVKDSFDYLKALGVV
jgi:sugar phosphate isomerase/epimerase